MTFMNYIGVILGLYRRYVGFRNNGESNGKENGKRNGNCDYCELYWGYEGFRRGYLGYGFGFCAIASPKRHHPPIKHLCGVFILRAGLLQTAT